MELPYVADRELKRCFVHRCVHAPTVASTPDSIQGNGVAAMYALYHPDYVPQRWHIFITTFVVGWLCNMTCMFGQRFLPRIGAMSGALVISGWLVTTLVCAIMPAFNGAGYASHSFVWTDWNNQTGYTSNGLVLLAGMLNGAYAIGTTDGVSRCCPVDSFL